MAYVLLGIAIICELFSTTMLEYSEGLTKFPQSAASLIGICTSYILLSKVLQHVNLGAAYATWSAVGIVVTTLIAMFVLKQTVQPAGIVGIVLIIAGCILVNMFSGI